MSEARIYTRFSPRPDAKECDSCEKQKERCLVYCEDSGHVVKLYYSDENVSGGELVRPRLSLLLKDLRQGEVVVVDSINRLARDMYVNLAIRTKIKEAGATLEFADGTTSNDTPEGVFIQNIFAALATFERDRIKFATSRGIKRRQARGEWFGKPPAGYVHSGTPGKLEIDFSERSAIERAISVKDIRTWEQVARLLRSEGYNFRGKQWSRKTIARAVKAHRSGKYEKYVAK